jgi:hypothetical protein
MEGGIEEAFAAPLGALAVAGILLALLLDSGVLCSHVV